jgi:peptidoglycan/xylan/chitin deacetylase (PgdA/CDA1 family)
MAVTIDDLPFVEYGRGLAVSREGTTRLVAALSSRRVPAVGFVNEDKLFVPGELDARVGLLEAWLDAGLDLGNHTWGHVSFQSTALDRYQEAVLKGEVVTRWIMARRNQAPRFFRHPFTHTGPTREDKAALEAFLAAHGYAVAPFTIENSDWVFARAYALARKAGDEDLSRRIRRAYLEYNDAMVAFFEGEARELFGRDIPQVLLVHANELHADCAGDLLDRLRERGYAFVPLDEALADPAYRSEDAFVGGIGPSWLHRWRVARGQDPRAALRREPDPPAWVRDLYSSR